MNREKYETMKAEMLKDVTHPFTLQNHALAVEFFKILKTENPVARYYDYGRSQIITYDDRADRRFRNMLRTDLKIAKQKIAEIEVILK